MITSNALELSDAARMRSGTAARLAGLPVTTLRVWERRYGVVAAPKTGTGQRLYSAADVHRLRALKQLTDCGHAIGTVAGLNADALDALVTQEAALSRGEASAVPLPGNVDRADRLLDPLRVWVVGRGAAQKLEALVTGELMAVHDNLDAAEAAAEIATSKTSASPDVLLVHLASLLPGAVERVNALATRLAAASVIVLYAFGSESLADTLRSAGATVRRDPMGAGELCALVTSVAGQKRGGAPEIASASNAHSHAQPATQARQFDDADLAFLMGISTNVACECPRHVAEIVMQLASFERYSQDCMSRTPADAELHAHLTAVAASARTGFERALQRVMTAEGIRLPQHEAPPVHS